MKINSVLLEKQAKQKLERLYLLAGEDPFLLQESQELLRLRAQEAGFVERIRLDIDADADLTEAYNHAYTPPLFNQKRLLELHWKAKLNKAGQDFLIAYSEAPSKHAVLVARIGKLDSRSEQTAWFKKLEKAATYVTHWPPNRSDLAGWLIQRAKSKGLQLTPEAAQLLAHAVEGNLQAASQELEKLSLLGESCLGRQTVETYVADQGCFSAFDLVDQALLGNAPQVLRILRYLQQEGSEPLMILGALMHELRTLTKLAKELKKGLPMSALFNQFHVRISRQNPVSAFLKRNTHENCYNFIVKAAEVDRILKGALPGNNWEALQIFSLSLASGYSRPPYKHI